jgi:hypothetical protein
MAMLVFVNSSRLINLVPDSEAELQGTPTTAIDLNFGKVCRLLGMWGTIGALSDWRGWCLRL